MKITKLASIVFVPKNIRTTVFHVILKDFINGDGLAGHEKYFIKIQTQLLPQSKMLKSMNF